MEYRGVGNVSHTGTAGVDAVSIYSGSGSVWGLGGNDSFWGLRSLLYFYGGDGDDNLAAEYSSCNFDGGAGNDILYMGYSSVSAFGGSGHDSITISSSSGTVHGDDGDDHIMGYQGELNLYGDDGNDTIEMVGAAANLYGGNGNDRLSAGTYAGLMAGGAGNDTYVLENIDTVCAEAEDEGFDAIRTATSNFTLGWANIEAVYATSNYGQSLTATVGPICLTGAGGNDRLTSGDGNDVLDGQGGNDTMTGGRGNDVYYVDSIADVCAEDREEGYDQVRTALASYTLQTANIEVLMGTSTRGQRLTTNVEGVTIIGGVGADSLYGTTGSETLSGGAGADTMYGGAGDDIYVVDNQADICAEAYNNGWSDEIRTDLGAYTLQVANIEILRGTNNAGQNLTAPVGYTRIYGAAGNDRLITGDDGFYLDGGAGADFMYGGWGYDTYIVDNQDDICAEAYNNGGGDEIRTDLATYALQVANIEILRGTNDRGQHLTATVSRIDINGAAGNDILTAGAYNDSLYGNAGDDALYGGAGNDTLYGGTGNDFMVGGAGDDTYYVDSQDDICADAPGEGTDTIINTGLAVFNCVVANIERIVGEYRSSSQALAADAGDQTIIGGRGSDILNGGRDNDTLIGNEGTDWLIGGQGNDLFVFSGTYGAGDRILDFHEGEDRISLGASGFGYYNGNLTPGTLSAAQFAVGASNSAANVGQVVFMPNTSGLYWDYNGSLEGGLILLAQMDNVHSLSASSFIVV